MPVRQLCPVCRTPLAFPDISPSEPVCCPQCDTRFKVEGRHLAHLEFTDYYRLLGILPDSSQEDIRRAIREKVMKHHPDRNPNDELATARLREIIEAKEILYDAERRKIYDSVYYAPPLPRWGQHRNADYSAYRTRTSQRGNLGSTYESMTRNARMRDRARSKQDDYLKQQIEDIFRQMDIPINLDGQVAFREKARKSVHWRWIGMLSLGLAGFLTGLLAGKIYAAVMLGILFGIGGWYIAYFSTGIVDLVFFLARVYIFSLPLALVSMNLGYGEWLTQNIGSFIRIFTTAVLIGGGALGLWWIAISSVHGRDTIFANQMVHRQAALGSWIGALWGLFMMWAKNVNDDQLLGSLGWWFVLFTLYLFLDTYIFGRT